MRFPTMWYVRPAKSQTSRGSSESTLVKIQHCWKSHVAAQIMFFFKCISWLEKKAGLCDGVPATALKLYLLNLRLLSWSHFFFIQSSVSLAVYKITRVVGLISFQDKKDIPWWLGISYKGIGVYDKNDKNVPRKVGNISPTTQTMLRENLPSWFATK